MLCDELALLLLFLFELPSLLFIKGENGNDQALFLNFIVNGFWIKLTYNFLERSSLLRAIFLFSFSWNSSG